MSINRNPLSINTGAPSVKPSLLCNFRNARNLPAGFVFTRADANGKRINQLGLVENSGVSVPRFDYNPISLVSKGLLIEPAATNNLLLSNTFASWTMGSGSSVSANDTTAPNGLLQMSTVTSNNDVGITKGVTGLTTSAIYTIYGFFAPGSATTILLRDVTQSRHIQYTFATDTVVTSGTLLDSGRIKLQNGVVLLFFTFTSSGTSVNINPRPSVQSGSTTFKLWECGLVSGSITSLISTSAATVTRLADTLTLAGTDFSNRYNKNENSLLVTFTANSVVGTITLFCISDTTTSNYIMIQLVSGVATATIVTSGVSQASLSIGTLSAREEYKIGLSWTANRFAATINGSVIAEDTSVTLPTVTQLNIGSDNASANSFNGTIADFCLFPKALSDSELINYSAGLV